MKKMRLILFLSALMTVYVAQSNEYKIYINPGHGGHNGANDRNIVIAPFAEGDTAGFWESNSNMHKAFRLRELLWEQGYDVVMSRVANTEDDDLGLTTIGRLANESGADLFLSIHSNATGTTSRRNFPLMLFRGYDSEAQIPGSKDWATVANKHLLTNLATVWTSTAMNVRGDWSFYNWGTQGLGVLRALTVTGMLSEGSFHDYIPEAYRLMNEDFKWLEAWNFRKAIDEWFSLPGVDYGAIAGRINDGKYLRVGDYKMFDDDLLATIENVKVELYNSDGTTKISEYTTDNLNNGIYAFRRVTPGTYKLKFTSETHHPTEIEVTVVADEVSYANIKMQKIRNTPPEVIKYSPVWTADSDSVLCNAPVIFDFNWDMDIESTQAAFSIEPAVEGEFTWENANARMIFRPKATYDTCTMYTVKLDTTAMHPEFLKLQKPVEFQFLTTSRNSMEIIGQFPKNGEEVHYKGANVEIRFDKIPYTTPILNQVIVYDSQDKKVTMNKRGMKYSKKGDEYGYFRLPFSKDLVVGETYRLEISGEVADQDGIRIKEPVTSYFKAVDAGAEKTDSIIESMEDALLYSINKDNTANIDTAYAGMDNSDMLFGNGCIVFTYEFSDVADGEILWSRSSMTDVVVEQNSTIGAHVFGDLTANEVYVEMTSDSDVKYVHLCDLTFLGWRYVTIKLSDYLESGKTYQMSGVKIVQKNNGMSRTGAFNLDNISLVNEDSGVEKIEIENLTVYPNPVSEYLIASADGLIEKIELVSMSGRIVASATGNVINVSDINEGAYIANIYTSKGCAVHKVIVKH